MSAAGPSGPLFSNVFIKIHEYSNYISLATNYKVRLLCLSITVISRLVL